MNKNYLYIMIPLFLSGCIGSLIGGHTEYLKEGYPNILTVPEREEANQPRGLHEGEEKQSRAAEFKELEKAREAIKVRDEALREGRFPESQKVDEESKLIPDDTGAPSESVGLGIPAP